MTSYDKFDLNGQKIKLFTPGPVYTPDWILAEMAKANDTHRSKPYAEMHGLVKGKLRKLLHTKNDVLIWTNSGSGVMEACIKNLVGPDDKVLNLTCGAFGNRWASMAKSNGKNFVKKEIEWGTGFNPEIVKEELSKDKFSTVCITMNETSTGVMNPLWDIGPIIKDYGALLCVDAVSCMSGVNIDVDKWGIDVCLASTQKCFALPAGIAISAVSDAAFEKSKEVPNRGWYLDFQVMKKKSDLDQTPTTPSSPHIRGLNAILDHIFKEGPENRYERHNKMSSMVQKWALEQGFKLFAQEGYRSKTVTTIANSKGIDIGAWLKRTIESGYRFVNGYGKELKEKTFRIGTMGELTPTMVEEFLDVITKLLP
ncbi:MAG: alanine--glyoxylate aminotransferase family protein [archaeon]|nr:alanine--glyoxylate aminotransferase family protein [archaeon]